MSFLKSLFGLGKPQEAEDGKVLGEEVYNGFTIRAIAMPAGGEHQLSGSVEKEVDGELKSHRFIRADKFAARDDAIAASLAKGRQIIDEQGEALLR